MLFLGHRGFWRPTQNFYARDGVHLNSLGQEKYHRSLRGAILRSFSLFCTISSCWIFNVSFHFPIEPLKFTYLPGHAFVLVTAVYVTDLPPLFSWAHCILVAVIVLTVLQNCCLPFVHNCLYLLTLALFILLSRWILWVCNPIRPPLFGCVLNALWYSFTTHLCQFLLHDTPFGFQRSSAIRRHYVCVYRLLKKQTNKQKQQTKFKGKINTSAQTFN